MVSDPTQGEVGKAGQESPHNLEFHGDLASALSEAELPSSSRMGMNLLVTSFYLPPHSTVTLACY